MNRKEVLLKTWEVANDNGNWFAHIRKALENVDAAQAAWKPEGVAGFNSIQEITYHLLYYKARFWSRLTRTSFETVENNEATFVAGLSMGWEEIREKLFKTNSKITEHFLTLEDSDLDRIHPKESIGQQILDLATHDAYHSGQIVLIRKLQGIW